MLFPLTGLRDVGGPMRPGTEWALPDAELQMLPGFGKDMEKNRAEAKQLLAEAGYPNGFKTTLKNRNVKLPYQDFAVYVIQEWRKIGIEVDNRPLETAAWFADLRDTGNFELGVQPTVEYVDDPDQFLRRYTTGDPSNYGRFSDPALDDLFSRQARTLDPAERKKLVHELQKQRPREGVLHAGPLVDTERRALGQGEELRGPAQPLHEPEAPGRLALGGLISVRSRFTVRRLLCVEVSDGGRIRRHRAWLTLVSLGVLVGSVVATLPAAGEAAETPRRGGVLLAVIGADAPSLDPHQEQTFATLQPVAPLYSTLLQIDPYSYPNIIGDVASEWTISPDGLTYTFKIRQDIRFHDGSPLTAADVKATYDKIIFPPDGVRSIRQLFYSAVASVEAPDPSTVVFRLKFPSASLLSGLASPWNVIFPKKYLDKDPNYFKNNVVGSGPFRFKSYTRGSTFEGERNPDYFVKDRPYLNGYKFFISTETSVRAAAIRSGRAYIEFRDLPLTEVETIKKHLGDKIVVQETPQITQFGIAINNTVKPFNDVRVRKALTLGIDRYTGARCCTRSRASGTPGPTRVRARSGRSRRPSSRSSRASGGTPRRAGPRPSGSWPRRGTPTASRSS